MHLLSFFFYERFVRYGYFWLIRGKCIQKKKNLFDRILSNRIWVINRVDTFAMKTCVAFVNRNLFNCFVEIWVDCVNGTKKQPRAFNHPPTFDCNQAQWFALWEYKNCFVVLPIEVIGVMICKDYPKFSVLINLTIELGKDFAQNFFFSEYFHDNVKQVQFLLKTKVRQHWNISKINRYWIAKQHCKNIN